VLVQLEHHDSSESNGGLPSGTRYAWGEMPASRRGLEGRSPFGLQVWMCIISAALTINVDPIAWGSGSGLCSPDEDALMGWGAGLASDALRRERYESRESSRGPGRHSVNCERRCEVHWDRVVIPSRDCQKLEAIQSWAPDPTLWVGRHKGGRRPVVASGPASGAVTDSWGKPIRGRVVHFQAPIMITEVESESAYKFREK
jgi:hypothetical protein